MSRRAYDKNGKARGWRGRSGKTWSDATQCLEDVRRRGWRGGPCGVHTGDAKHSERRTRGKWERCTIRPYVGWQVPARQARGPGHRHRRVEVPEDAEGGTD